MTEADKLIEAVAKALYERPPSGKDKAWSLLTRIRRDGWTVDARAALSAIEASGWVLVPAEPTQGMFDEASQWADAGAVYKSMLAARPRITGETE